MAEMLVGLKFTEDARCMARKSMIWYYGRSLGQIAGQRCTPDQMISPAFLGKNGLDSSNTNYFYE